MISCVISTYKREPEILKRAISSAQMQTYPDLEIIVVNDAPEEKELEARIHAMINDLHDDRMQYVLHDRNRGACAARNTGAALAKGEFLAFLDDDDEWLPEKLEEQMKLMEDPEVGFVTCDSYMVYQTGEKKYVRRTLPSKYSTALEAELEGNYLGGVSFPLIRASSFFQVGQFDIEMMSQQDTDLYIRLLKVSSVAICQKPLLKYYLTTTSITASVTAKEQGFRRLLEKYREDYERHPEIYRQKLLWIGRQFMYYNALRLAFHYFFQAAVNGASLREIYGFCKKGYSGRQKAIKAGHMR